MPLDEKSSLNAQRFGSAFISLISLSDSSHSAQTVAKISQSLMILCHGGQSCRRLREKDTGAVMRLVALFGRSSYLTPFTASPLY